MKVMLSHRIQNLDYLQKLKCQTSQKRHQDPKTLLFIPKH